MIHDVALGEVLERAADLWPEKTALTYGDGVWSFRELFVESCRAAQRMRSLGIQPGEHVALWSANIPEWVFLQFGLARLGAVLVTANTALARDDLTYLLQNSDSVSTISPTHRRRVSGSGQNTSIRIKSGTVEHDDPPESNIQPHNNTGLPSACIQPGGRLSEIVEWSEIPNFSHGI